MVNAVLDKIKPVCDLSFISQFDMSDMETYHFVPVCVARGSAYVLTIADSDKQKIKELVSLVVEDDNVSIKSIEDQDFLALFDYVVTSLKEDLESDDDETEESEIIISNENEDEKLDSESLLIKNSEDNEQNEVVVKVDETEDSASDDSSNLTIKYNLDEETAQKDVKEEEPSVEYNPQKKNDSPEKYYTMKIGEVLVDKGYVTPEQVFTALGESKKSHVPLGTILVQQGIITLDDLKEALTAQQGYDTVTTEQLKISDSVLSILPEDFIKINKVIPISYDDKVLVVGMVNPNDKKVINDIIFLTGLKPSILIITQYEFSMCVQKLFSENKKTTAKFIKRVARQSQALNQEETLFEQAQKELKDDSNIVVKFVNKIISDGIDMKASDIHIEPRLEGYVVRYRKDGILHQLLELPEKTESAILTRLKVISKMNIAEHRRPQDGSFSITYKNQDYDFRINTLPVGEQEKMVIRILAPAVSMSSSKDEMFLVGASPEDMDIIKKMETVPNGIILTTGPTGSGKTTTLYTLLKAINDEKINITTIEDPIEIRIDGINQSQINAKAGITFASCMRAILRQDPDVILVGEIRDIETLETAISAALTGHLVLSTLHTNSAASTITRLIDMGAKDYLVSSTLIGIIAQRLVRQLCPHCRSQYYPTRQEAEMVIAGEEKDIQAFMKTPVYKSNGCPQCNFEGYKGRLGVYEIMPVTKEIKKLIAQGAHDIQIEEAAIGSGMNTLHRACLKHIVSGNTTISEFLRVLGPVKE